MIFESKQTVNGKAVWTVDTDTQTVTHTTKSGETEEHYFSHDCVRYHLHYCEEYYPERLQNLVDNGEIYRYLDEFDNKVTDAVYEQAELLMQNDRAYRVALEIGDLNKMGAIGNAYTQQAREMVFETMVYEKQRIVVGLSAVLFSSKPTGNA